MFLCSCALWSSEVYEEIDGSLQNVCQAVNRGSKLLCTYCDEKGATVGCCHATCSTNYHFQCGLSDGAAYKVNCCRFLYSIFLALIYETILKVSHELKTYLEH